MADANTYTGNLGSIESNIASLTKAISEGYSGLPGVNAALRKALSEREKTLPGLEQENESKIQELYTADKRLAERYANPESNMYIENPMNRQAIISGQKADIRGELGGILNLIQSRSQVLGNALDKGMEMYKAGLEAQKFELEQASAAWDRLYKKQQASKSGTDYSPYLALLQALAGNTNEEMPNFSPKTGVGTKSAGGQWTYTGKGVTGWEQTGGNQKMTNILEAAQSNPQVAAIAFSNWGDIFPKEESPYTTDTSVLDSYIKGILSGGTSSRTALSQLNSTQQMEVQARANELGIDLNPKKEEETGGNWFQNFLNSVSGNKNQTSGPSPTDIADAQSKIDQYKDPLQRADVYQQIIDLQPELKGYISY